MFYARRFSLENEDFVARSKIHSRTVFIVVLSRVSQHWQLSFQFPTLRIPQPARLFLEKQFENIVGESNIWEQIKATYDNLRHEFIPLQTASAIYRT